MLPGRAAIGVLEVPGYPPFLGVSLYLIHSNGPGADNTDILAKLGAAVDSFGLPPLIGGDLQMKPDAFATTGFAEAIGSTLVVPHAPRGTCHGAAGRLGSTLDYFIVVDSRLAKELVRYDYSQALRG